MFFSLVEGDAKVRRCPVHNGNEENAEDRSFCVHQGHEATLLQSCLNFKDHGDHQETHGTEELTKGVVLKHIVAVTTVVPQLDVKAEQREEIVVDTVAKTWRREIPAGTKFWLSVLCLDQCSVGRSWMFHAKLQMRLLLFTVWDLYHRMWIDIRAGVLAAKGQLFLLFAYNACNACFGPWNTHANFDSKKAWFSAWLLALITPIFASHLHLFDNVCKHTHAYE